MFLVEAHRDRDTHTEREAHIKFRTHKRIFVKDTQFWINPELNHTN